MGGPPSPETGYGAAGERKLVLAAWMKGRHDRQVRIREKPLFSLGARRFGDRGQFAEVLVARDAAEMFEANAREAGDLFLGEDLLARLDPDHSGPLDLSDAKDKAKCGSLSLQ